jgi:hypothetical protein
MQTPFPFLQTVVFVHQRTARSFLIVLLLDWAKGLQRYRSIALLGWPLLPRGNSTSPKFRGLEMLSLRDSLRSSTHEGVPGWLMHPWETLLPWNSKERSAVSTRCPMSQHPCEYQGDIIANSTPYGRLPTDAPTRARNSFFGSRVTRFGRDPSHHIETPTWIFTRRSTSKGGTRNGLLITFLEESHKSTSSVSTSRLHSDSLSGAEASGSQKNKMTARKGTLSNQPRLTCVTPTALLGSWVLQPIKVWRSLGLTSRSVPYGKGPLRNPLWRIL